MHAFDSLSIVVLRLKTAPDSLWTAAWTPKTTFYPLSIAMQGPKHAFYWS